MRVYFRYAVKETLSNLWRNRMMTIAAVLTVAVSLSLVGAALLLKQSAAQASSQWQQGTRVTVWMQPTASTGEIANVQTQLGNLPIVKTLPVPHAGRGLRRDEADACRSRSGVSSSSRDIPTKFSCIADGAVGRVHRGVDVHPSTRCVHGDGAGATDPRDEPRDPDPADRVSSHWRSSSCSRRRS